MTQAAIVGPYTDVLRAALLQYSGQGGIDQHVGSLQLWPSVTAFPEHREEEHEEEGDSVTKMHEDLSGGWKGWWLG